jgi:arginyl-tRNA synthetase
MEGAMFEQELKTANDRILKSFENLDLFIPERIDWIPTPFEGRWGFGTNACFLSAAAEVRERSSGDVPTRAQEIAASIAENLIEIEGFSQIEAQRGYLNLYIEPSAYAQHVVDTILDQGDDFGRGEPKDEMVMVEYAQPNTHHSFHIGHARNAVLGESLARIVEFSGYETLRASYPGDIGLGVITCMWAYQKFYQGQEPSGVHERGQWLAKIYSDATAMFIEKSGETEEDRKLRQRYEEERRTMYQQWDAGDPEVRDLWQRTRQWSLDELDEILKLLGIQIDVFFFESQVDQPAKVIVDELIDLGIAEDERPEGPVIVKIDEKLGLKKEKYRTGVILRSDGTTLYLTKDLALAKEKFEKYNVDRSIYVVDVRQSLHFQQAFKILELWGFPQAPKCHHLAYGFVTLPEGAMSSRLGNVILYMDVVEEAYKRVLEIIAEKNPDLPEETRIQVSRQVGLGAITYSMLAIDNNKDIVFDWDTALSFDGQSAPYIQNAHVRASSILRKAIRLLSQAAYDYQLSTIEIELIELLSRFPDVVQRAANENKPLHMATYAYNLAKTFHGFYHSVRVLQAETEAISDARLRITAATQQTLANTLRLLGIEAPEVM